MNIKTIFQKIDATVARYQMLSDGDTVVLGVSGGADSMLLLHYFLSKENRYRLIVANVEHGIRGEASRRDTAFVQDFCEARGVEFHSLSIQAPTEAKACGEGVEAYSRKRRYAFFESFGADKIATAHNQSDNAETFLFRLSRGTSPRGACGIPPVRGRIIRPLIECSAAEIRQACGEAAIDYVIDETNDSLDYARNYIRHVMIPDFEKLNPRFDAAICRLMHSLNEQEAFLEAETHKAYAACVSENTVELARFRTYPEVLQKRVLEKLVSLDEQKLSEVLRLVAFPGKTQLHGNLYAVADSRTLRITALTDTPPRFIAEQRVIPCADYLGEQSDYKDYIALDADAVNGTVTVRSRREGDRITPAGRGGSKSLKKLFNEQKIPVERRLSVPVICDDGGVIGVYPLCVDERVAIRERTARVCLLSIHTEDNHS